MAPHNREELCHPESKVASSTSIISEFQLRMLGLGGNFRPFSAGACVVYVDNVLFGRRMQLRRRRGQYGRNRAERKACFNSRLAVHIVSA
jgi:hypothetical protein